MAKRKAGAGRRPGNPDTRQELVDTARVLFREQGYDATSVRAIASATGVDAAMVNHYFGGKEGLFEAVMELPVDLTEKIHELLDGLTPEMMPQRVAQMFVHVWEGPQTGPAMVAMLRRALSDPEQIELMREFMTGGVFVPVTNLLGEVRPHDAGLRTAMIASQAIGLMTARHILKIAPLDSLPTDQLASLLEGAITHLVNDGVDTASVPADSTREGHQS